MDTDMDMGYEGVDRGVPKVCVVWRGPKRKKKKREVK